MESIIYGHFEQVYIALKQAGKIKSVRQFAISLDIAPQSMDLIVKGKRNVTLDLVRKLASRYHVNANYLCLGEGPMFRDPQESNDEGADCGRITYVPVSAAAGYGDQFRDPVYLQDLPTFSLPEAKYKHGVHRCFDVSGDSMEPTLYTGEKVVCSQMEQQYWKSSIRDGEVYVVILHGDVLVKRVINRIAESRTLHLHSDNDFYPARVVDISEVSEVWHVNVKISSFSSSPASQRDSLYDEIAQVRAELQSLREGNRSINRNIERVLKHDRSKSYA